MPLTVQQLNADTTFLLTFSSPSTSPPNRSPNADFSILIDPWLTGPSPIFHSAFAVSRHTTDAAISSLAGLSTPPDLVVISQPKNDHCNRETLCTMPKSWKGGIVAVPAAAKKIRAWNYFENDQVHVVPAYSAKDPKTTISLPTADTSGSITITYIPEPFDLAAVHNAIAITYNPPSPARTPPFRILYTPHGITPSLLTDYHAHHLKHDPIDLLFHSLNIEANPRLFGGVISNGAPGGVTIAKMLGVRWWVGAHDEVKENAGLATKLIRCTAYGTEDVEGLLREGGVEGTRVMTLGVGEVMRIDEERGSTGSDGFRS